MPDNNDYGVYRLDGTNQIWVITVSPLTEGSSDNAARYSEQSAQTTATYLNSLDNGNTYFIGHVPKPH